jgi:hypothetical protein
MHPWLRCRVGDHAVALQSRAAFIRSVRFEIEEKIAAINHLAILSSQTVLKIN